MNISSYLPLSGGTYCKLPKELQHNKNGLINIQNNDNKCHVRYLSCNDKNLWGMSGKDKEISENLNYSGIEFPVSKKIIVKLV